MAEAINTVSVGKSESEAIGLALSGGGFRAAFFHVGVLANLAERGVLAKVEVISTVSGGSIAGALYYLKLKRLLECKADSELETAAYVALVAEVECELRRAVQQNIRARVFANPFKNLRMLGRKYSRSDRVGDLCDRYLYKPAWDKPRPTDRLGREQQIELRELLIRPPGSPDFVPSAGNAAREHKVPVLVINATSLNSGHNWRFEATRMGEALPKDPALRRRVEGVDKNMRLLQAYFEIAGLELPPGAHRVSPEQGDFPLALAVAASAAVPGVFHPLSISDLYDGIRVQLVDGGVQDNQGVQALRDRGCETILISDASGQMADKDKPVPIFPFAPLRSSSVAQDRIRDAQLVEALKHDVPPMHLRMGLEAETVPPLGNPEERSKDDNVGPGKTAFGVDRRVQDRLSRVRTDLDYFSDTEAFALELDGYRICSHQPGVDQLSETVSAGGAEWPFLSLSSAFESPDKAFLGELGAAKMKFLRPLKLRPWSATAVSLVCVAVLALAGWLLADPLGELLDWCWPLGVLAIMLLVSLLPIVWANVKARLPWLYVKRRTGR